MAEGDAKVRFLSLIRDVASERSYGERRVAVLKKRFSELQTELDAENYALEEAKCTKEVAEKELRGSEFALGLIEASINAYKARVLFHQEEISKIQSESELLKKEESVARDDFLEEMVQFNKKIREVQRAHEAGLDQRSSEGKNLEVSHFEDKKTETIAAGLHAATTGQENDLAYVKDQIRDSRNELEKYEAIYNQVSQEIANLQIRLDLMEAIARETKELQSVSKQAAEAEQEYASVSLELRIRYTCPRCQMDNMGDMLGNAADGSQAMT